MGDYERFDRVILAHGVRTVGDLAYRDYLTAYRKNKRPLSSIEL